MTTSLIAMPIPGPAVDPIKRRRVLLVDASPAKRELRAEAMRKLGVDVDCASDITEARSWWRADQYNLVLINLENDLGHRDKFCEDMRAASPPQQMAFFVGKPEYLAGSPNLPELFQVKSDIGLVVEPRAPHASDNTGPALPWGILEASRRISAARSVSAAHTSALRNRPTPPRDVEGRASRRAEVMAQLASELQKEDLL